jgi:hypothetical protein
MNQRKSLWISGFLVVYALAGLAIWWGSNPHGLETNVAVRNLADFAAKLLLLCAFTGICAMATVEFVIRLAPLRGRFQRTTLEQFLGPHGVYFLERSGTMHRQDPRLIDGGEIDRKRRTDGLRGSAARDRRGATCRTTPGTLQAPDTRSPAESDTQPSGQR